MRLTLAFWVAPVDRAPLPSRDQRERLFSGERLIRGLGPGAVILNFDLNITRLMPVSDIAQVESCWEEYNA